MTIESHNNGGSWHCIWFDETDLKRGNFNSATLVRYDLSE